ncbi:hypothetical protein B0H17DRAFT_1214977 [Mycena rosella]|uniref:Uncharacterized protein n=1 Tax=Mycena rosella TaxID=1033263 RepID=A0AAD7CP79_MYCRO|nr:hypothetical protein B0H17DRAFT_1214977 [Mycena rosella]
MDDWFSLHPRPRRGRSQQEYAFTREAPGPVVRAQKPYAFINCLQHQNDLATHHEINDPVYRGDVRPHEACSWLPHEHSISESADNDLLQAPSPAAAMASGAGERLSSPVTPGGGRTPSPTVTEMQAGPRHRIITYTRSDRERIHAEHARNTAAASIRRSDRLRRGPVGAGRGAGVLRAETLLTLRHDVVPWVEGPPRPVIDHHGYVIAAVADGPKGEALLWNSAIKEAGKSMRRMFRNGLFSGDGDTDSRVRFGIGYGEEYAAPHEITSTATAAREIEWMRNNQAFNIISAYQNHLYAQFAPRGYASVTNKIGVLVDHQIVYPAFDNSVFTTTEINFCDAPTLSQKNYNGAIDTMEVVTLIGFHPHQKSGYIVFWEDDKVLEIPWGGSVIGQRFLFRQFCHASVLRWVDKGGRSNTEFETFASPEELAAWEDSRARRGQAGLKMFSKVNELFV